MSTQEKMGWLEKLFTYLQQYHVSMNEQQLRSNYMHPAKVLNIPASSQFVFQISINQGTTQRSPDFCKELQAITSSQSSVYITVTCKDKQSDNRKRPLIKTESHYALSYNEYVELFVV
ncbi:uncharacterized protein LOC144647878 [Oculina patagonica]